MISLRFFFSANHNCQKIILLYGMATKVHYKSYFSEHSEMINLNEDTSNSWRPFYLRNTMNERFNNGCNANPIRRYSEFEKELLKRTMLEHEAIFRNQVYELHRLYSIQKNLMEEFLNNGSSKFFKLKDSSKETVCSSQVQSEWAKRMLQASPLPVTSSVQQREKTIETNKNISPKAFHQCAVQCSFNSSQTNGQQIAAESNSRFGKCSKRIFDLELPADAYIDDSKRLQDIRDSSAVKSYFGICNENNENKMKLNFANANGFNVREKHKMDYNESGSLFSTTSELSKPSEQTSFPMEFCGLITQPGEGLGHKLSLRSTKLCLRSTFSNDGTNDRSASGKVTPEQKQKFQEGSSRNSDAGKHCLAHLFSPKKKQPVLFEPVELKERMVNERNLTDCIETSRHVIQEQGNGSQISEEFPRQLGFESSAMQTSMMPNFLPSSPKLESKTTLAPKVSTWTKLSGDVNSLLSPFVEVSALEGTKKQRKFHGSGSAIEGHGSVGNGLHSDSLNGSSPVVPPFSNCRIQLNSPFNHVNLNIKDGSSFSNGQCGSSAQQNKANNDRTFEDLLLGHIQSSPACETLDVSHHSLQMDLGFKKMDQGNEGKTKDETCLPSSNLKAISSAVLAKERSNKLCYNYSIKKNGENLNELEQVNQSCDGKPSSNEKSLSMVNNRNRRKRLIDLNYEFAFIDETESAEFKSLDYSDPVAVSGAIPSINLDATFITSQKDAILPVIETAPSSKTEEFCTENNALITEAAANIIKLSLDGSKPKDHVPGNALDWLAKVILSNTEGSTSTAVGDYCLDAPDNGFDLFEIMTLKLEEMKPELPCWRTWEVDSAKDIEQSKSSILLGKLRRAQGKKRRQKKDFQKDVLPGLATLSRQEAIEDLQTIGELMKESGLPLEVLLGTKSMINRGTKARHRRRQKTRTAAVASIIVDIGSPEALFMAKNNGEISEYKTNGKHMLGWGSKTRRCRSQRCSPIRIPATLI
ncbi:hypothetical protein HPP92_001529 [Vanilla planifolia]|uniref:Uncharacterized protein n=1 Tax=Vanilla planifolia TaxID=51239 RepID=A0A835VJR7_VANPL|nr:hypothetical protein HPP92_001529 [Vanilla planifolia]